jgi:Zn ribbon nucleic-acid-binding protein
MEEFIFDDDVDEVGAEVEAHCPKCKADTQHVVVSKYEDEIRRVQCNPCGDVHPYRKPRGEGDEEAEPTPAQKKKAAKAKPTWEQVMAKSSKKQPKPYQLGEYFKENELLSHPKFGVGFVSENIGDDKIEVTFKDDKRVLVHNRKGLTLPFMRPIPQAKGKGQGQGKKSAAAPAPAAPAPSANGSAKKGAAAAKPAPAAKAAPPAPKAQAKPAKPAPKPAAKKPAATKQKAAARTASKKPVAKPAAKKKKTR